MGPEDRSTQPVATFRRGQEDLDGRLDGLGPDRPGLAVDAARDLAELAVDEDPVVQLAAPALEVGVADEPADLGEGGAERRAVDGDATAARPGALDHLDAAVLGGRARAAGRAVRTACRSSVSSRTLWASAIGPAVAGRPRPGPPPEAGGSVLAELAIGGDVRQPAEVRADTLAGQVHGADRPRHRSGRGGGR